jgi:metallophosphoesterase superfamily enzyme
MRFAVLYDIHIGYETRVDARGVSRRHPVHDVRALATTFHFLEYWCPHVVVLGGDQLNLFGVSRHTYGKALQREGHRLREDYELLDRLVIRPIEELQPAPIRKIWHNGNHEDWLFTELQERTPALEGIISPIDYLDLEARGWEIRTSSEFTRLGKLYICHGSALRAKDAAKRYVSLYRRNIRIGHYHTYQVHADVHDIADRSYHTAVVVPALASCDFTYRNGMPSDALQGFLIGEYDPRTGHFNDQVLIMNEHRIIYDGKIFYPKGWKKLEE